MCVCVCVRVCVCVCVGGGGGGGGGGVGMVAEDSNNFDNYGEISLNILNDVIEFTQGYLGSLTTGESLMKVYLTLYTVTIGGLSPLDAKPSMMASFKTCYMYMYTRQLPQWLIVNWWIGETS